MSSASSDVSVRGSWDDWQTAHEPQPESGARLLRLELDPGEHQYLLQRGEELYVDPANPLTGFRAADGEEVSVLLVPDCSKPSIAVWDVEASADGTLSVRGQFLASNEEEPLDEGTLRAVTSAGVRVGVATVDASTGGFTLRATGLPRGKHTVRIEASDAGGVAADPARVAAFVAPAAESWQDGLVYQIMIDRFRGDAGAPLSPPPTPGSRAGGTLSGVQSALEDGTLEALGVTALWLSPVYTNPDAARLGRDGNLYEGYHGYWPLESRGVDARLGGEAALDALIAAAHERGIRVLLDIVPNHVYEENPLYAQKLPDGWFTEQGCVCGSEACPWSENIETCWFTEYLPDLRWRAPGTMPHAAEEARFWLERFDVDGFRVDAVPMMPRATTRRIAHELRTTTDPREATFLLGEVFTGPGAGALGQLGAYLGPATLDSVFDFPLMWALQGAMADGDGGFDEVEAILAAGDLQFRGSGAVLAHMLDNHDTARFFSVANGDASADPWGASPAAQPTSAEAYARQTLGLVALLTLPGLPVLYYGDEVALAGGSDPDSRRVMPEDDALLEPQRAVRDVARTVGQLRRCSEALRRGGRKALHVEPRVWAFSRGDDAADDRALVLVHASTGPSAAQLPGTALPAGSYVDVLSGAEVTIDAGSPVEVPPLTARVLVPSSSPCR